MDDRPIVSDEWSSYTIAGSIDENTDRISFGDITYDEEESEKWGTAMSLGEEGRETLKGHDAAYYFDIWKKVRARTLEEFKKKDDVWLNETVPGSSMNNHWAWFHVMEHQSSHLGQMLLLKKRIPDFPDKEEVEIELGKKVKN